MADIKTNTMKKFREELTEIRKLIADQNKLIDADPDSFAYQLSLQSLRHREKEIEMVTKTAYAILKCICRGLCT